MGNIIPKIFRLIDRRVEGRVCGSYALYFRFETMTSHFNCSIKVGVYWLFAKIHIHTSQVHEINYKHEIQHEIKRSIYKKNWQNICNYNITMDLS